jgi:exopolyphosphatase / guanosine-5'-triphosphate,3'-diphosphate pyrophosphatase
MVVEAALDLPGVDQLSVCPWALREGLILRFLDGLR